MADSNILCKPSRLAVLGLAIAGLVAAAPPCVNAATSTTSSQESLEATSSNRDSSQIELASEWGLTLEDWSRYKAVMKGPRGIYSPGLDPLTALGIEATSAEDRRRYAELQVKAERRRVEKELAYQQAYDQAFKRLYPDEKIIQLSASPASPMTSSPRALKSDGRLAIFVQDNCMACVTRVQNLQAQNQPFDLYFVGSQGDDEMIRRWAVLAKIEPTRVLSRAITLNHDAGRWLGLGLGGELPAVVREVNSQWQRQ